MNTLLRQGVTGLVVCTVALAIALVDPGPGQASPAASSALSYSITMDSGPADYVGQGADYEFDSANSQLQINGSDGIEELDLSQPHEQLDLEFAPPAHTSWHDGLYPDASSGRYGADGVADINISGGGRGCDSPSGSFDVRDVAVVHGRVTRLDLTFDEFCGDGVEDPTEIGQVQLGEPGTSGAMVSTNAVMWGTTDAGASSEVPAALTVHNETTKSITVGRPRITGPDATSYRLVADTCPTRLRSGEQCVAGVNFVPAAAGPRSAVVSWTVDGSSRSTQLSGIGAVGDTTLSVDSPAGDELPTGSFRYTLDNAFLYPGGGGVTSQSITSQTGRWVVEAQTVNGFLVRPGTYSGASNTPKPGGNYLDITGGSQGCDTDTGSFVVDQAVYGGSGDDAMAHFRARYVQRCSGAASSVTVQFDWNYAPVLTPPHAPGQLRAVRHGEDVTLSWSRTGVRDVAYSVVRVASGRSDVLAPNSGDSLYSGRGRDVTTGALHRGDRYTVTVYDVDRYGNVSRGETITI